MSEWLAVIAKQAEARTQTESQLGLSAGEAEQGAAL